MPRIFGLTPNIKAHDFIAAQYWLENIETVKEMLAQAEVYVYEDEGEIQGFIGLNDDYIAGIFVRYAVQSSGIGKQLLDFVKSIKKELHLNVYQKNMWAIKFYQREKFIDRKSTCEVRLSCWKRLLKPRTYI